MADTSTTLNPGVGGDALDESSVLQSDGVTSVKRARVVLGGDAGFNGADNDLVQPVNADPGASPMALPVLSTALVDDTPPIYISGETRAMSLNPEGRLRVITASEKLVASCVDDSQASLWEQVDIVQNNSPWGGW